MAYKKYASIRVRPVVFERDTNGDFILDTNGDKVIEVQPNEVNSTLPYDYLVEIEEFE
jgi:hypothetical protein